MTFETGTGKDVRFLVGPEAKVQNMEAKIDTLADQLSNLPLILQNSQFKLPKEPSSKSIQRLPHHERAGSNCRKPGHGAK